MNKWKRSNFILKTIIFYVCLQKKARKKLIKFMIFPLLKNFYFPFIQFSHLNFSFFFPSQKLSISDKVLPGSKIESMGLQKNYDTWKFLSVYGNLGRKKIKSFKNKWEYDELENQCIKTKNYLTYWPPQRKIRKIETNFHFCNFLSKTLRKTNWNCS